MRQTCLAIALICFQQSLVAQTVPDAGALMRQNEQMLRQNQMQALAKQRPSALPPAMDLKDVGPVIVKSFKFSGNKLLKTQQLTDIASSYLGRELTSHDFQHLTDAISEAYRGTGWLVHAYVPRQDLSRDEVVIQVIESIPPTAPR